MEKVINIIHSPKQITDSIKRGIENSGYIPMTWELSEVSEDHFFSGPTIALIDEMNESDILNISNKCRSLGIGFLSAEKDIDLESLPNLAGIINFSSVLLKYELQTFFDLSSVFSLEDKLDNILEIAESEMNRIKKLHEKFVPMRTDKFKGISIQSKFAAGESSGGEFFDFFEIGSKIIILLSNCNSYLLSSSILSLFDIYKSSEKYSDSYLESFVNSLQNDYIQAQTSSKKQLSLSLCLMSVDKKSLEVEGYSFGKFEICSNGGRSLFSANDYPFSRSFNDQARFNSRLERAASYFIATPGVFYNTGDNINGQSIVSFLSTQIKENDATSVINEIFYQLKKERKSSFLEFDATVLSIEVDSNVIVQV